MANEMATDITIITRGRNPLEYCGSLYRTAYAARRACFWQWLSAGGENGPEIISGLVETMTARDMLAEMEDSDWHWPIGTTPAEALDVAHVVISEIKADPEWTP